MKKKIVAMLLTFVMAIGMAGCGQTEVEESKEADTTKVETEEKAEEKEEEPAEVVNLKIYSGASEQADQEKVLAALNEYTKEKIGVTADWIFCGGTYADKIQVVISSGEEYDICFTSDWMNSFNSNVTKGAFVDLSEMLPEVAPALYETIPDYMWAAATVNGGIYAVPNQQIVAKQAAINVTKEYADPSGIDYSEFHTITDFEEIIQYAYDNNGVKFGGLAPSGAPDYTGYEMIAGYLSAGAIKMGDENAKVVNLYETEEWLGLLNEMASLDAKGLVDSEAAISVDAQNQKGYAKLLSVWIAGTMMPGGDVIQSTSFGYPIARNGVAYDPYVTTSSIIATMNGISTTSKNPEAALKYLELISTDSYAFNLLSYGFEGDHYEKVSDNVIRIKENSTYNNSGWNWSFGNTFVGYVLEGQPEDVYEQTAAMNNSAVVSPLLGFSFDAEPVQSEIASVNKVVNEYIGIMGGNLPVEETNAEFVEKLKAAGVEKVIAEMQAQVDAFMAAK